MILKPHYRAGLNNKRFPIPYYTLLTQPHNSGPWMVSQQIKTDTVRFLIYMVQQLFLKRFVLLCVHLAFKNRILH